MYKLYNLAGCKRKQGRRKEGRREEEGRRWRKEGQEGGKKEGKAGKNINNNII